MKLLVQRRSCNAALGWIGFVSTTGLLSSLTNYLIIYLVAHDTTITLALFGDGARRTGMASEPTNGKQELEMNQRTAALHYGIAWNGYVGNFFLLALHYGILQFSS